MNSAPRRPQQLAGVTRHAFSLVELVIVIVIIGIIAAIAVPRFGKATEGANENQTISSVLIIQNALDLAMAEHNNSLFSTAAEVVTNLNSDCYDTPPNILTCTTDAAGASGSDFGPYLRSIPDNLFKAKDASTFAAAGAGTYGDTVGWVIEWNNGPVVGYVDAGHDEHYP